MTDRVPLCVAEIDLQSFRLDTPLGSVALTLPPHLSVRKAIYRPAAPSIYPVLIVELEERQ